MTIPFFTKTKRAASPANGATARVFISRDAAAVAVGADGVAMAIVQAAAATGRSVDITRTGSRGMLWLEPLVEVEIAGVRHGFGPIEPADVAQLVNAGLFNADASRCRRTRGRSGPSTKSAISRVRPA
jgi:hypothetical protein